MKTNQLNGITNDTGVNGPKYALEVQDGRLVVDMQPVSSRQAVLVDYEMLKLLVNRLPTVHFDDVKRTFAEKVEECQTVAEYRALLAEEFVFHSTIELVNTTDVEAVIKVEEQVRASMESVMEQV